LPTGGATTTDVLGYPSTSNRVVQVVRGTATRTLTYNNAGNLLSDNGGGIKSYVYNKRNRLSQATVGALVYNYTYNALEQLVTRAQVSPATTTHFIHDRMGNVIAETAGGGATGTTGTTREYIYLYEAEIAPTMASRTVVDRPLAVVNAVNTATPATYWVSVDHLNRPVKMTTATKASVWDAIWQPWGGAHSLIVTGTAVFDARFPGQWFQTETGLHYNWHRSYDPTLGRYTQPDPLGFVDGPSVYGYAGGSPQRYVDRDGRIAGVDDLVIGGGVIIVGCAVNQSCRKAATQCIKDIIRVFRIKPERSCFLIKTEPNHCTYQCKTEKVVLWKSYSDDCAPIIDEDNQFPF
jgi:RHS repeat-associated protein